MTRWKPVKGRKDDDGGGRRERVEGDDETCEERAIMKKVRSSGVRWLPKECLKEHARFVFRKAVRKEAHPLSQERY